MTRDGKILLAVLALTIGFGAYSHTTLKKEVQHAQRVAQMCFCPQDNYGQVASMHIQQHHRYATTSHSYFERLLEGLVRHAGLPLEKAREDLTRSHGKFIPEDWKWLQPWETEGKAPHAPAPAPTPHPPAPTPPPPAFTPDMAPKSPVPLPMRGSRHLPDQIRHGLLLPSVHA